MSALDQFIRGIAECSPIFIVRFIATQDKTHTEHSAVFRCATESCCDSLYTHTSQSAVFGYAASNVVCRTAVLCLSHSTTRQHLFDLTTVADTD